MATVVWSMVFWRCSLQNEKLVRFFTSPLTDMPNLEERLVIDEWIFSWLLQLLCIIGGAECKTQAELLPFLHDEGTSHHWNRYEQFLYSFRISRIDCHLGCEVIIYCAIVMQCSVLFINKIFVRLKIWRRSPFSF